MHRCIQLAKNGMQNAQPNPMVGAVIVAPDGTIIGEGYHVRHGEGHAEVNAFASVRPEHQHLLPESTLYVSLEPCSHYGKTPPCADLIINKGVRRVVVGCIDPFAEVQGRGIGKLRNAGIEVTVGVCEAECKELNKVFFTFHRFHRPFVTLKWAQSADGFIGSIASDGRQQASVLSNIYTQMMCHKRRAEHQAIMVGHTTWTVDHPSLTVRLWHGRNPRRVVLTNDDGGEGWQFDEDVELHKGLVSSVLAALYDEGVQSVLVEGGRMVLQQFIDSGLWDEAFVEHCPCLLHQGTMAPRLPGGVYSQPLSFFGRTIMKYVSLTD